ncbi:hypothetical protein E4M08_09655, partial [Histophilus somni]
GIPILRNLGLGMIGNNPNATPNKANVSFLDAHSEANQNINNLKFVYDSNNKKDKNFKENTEKILKSIHLDLDGVRKFNKINKNNERK